MFKGYYNVFVTTKDNKDYEFYEVEIDNGYWKDGHLRMVPQQGMPTLFMKSDLKAVRYESKRNT